MSSPTTDIKTRLCRLAADAGACACGFAPAVPLPDSERRYYRNWIASGRHAGMTYMERYEDIRFAPSLLLNGCQSVMSLAFSYSDSATPDHPLFARYALGKDYHDVLRRRLEPIAAAMETACPGSRTRICVDTAPVRERYWAVQAGVGFIGLNNSLIVPDVGSRVFLAEIFWTASVDADEPCDISCGNCGSCIHACPGRALDGKGALDARRCYSYLTIEHRDALPDRADLSDKKIYGCDICQNVCPHNRGAGAPIAPEFRPSPGLMDLSLDDVLAMNQEDFSRIFRGSAVKRAKLSGLLRNALRKKTGD